MGGWSGVGAGDRLTGEILYVLICTFLPLDGLATADSLLSSMSKPSVNLDLIEVIFKSVRDFCAVLEE